MANIYDLLCNLSESILVLVVAVRPARSDRLGLADLPSTMQSFVFPILFLLLLLLTHFIFVIRSVGLYDRTETNRSAPMVNPDGGAEFPTQPNHGQTATVQPVTVCCWPVV